MQICSLFPGFLKALIADSALCPGVEDDTACLQPPARHSWNRCALMHLADPVQVSGVFPHLNVVWEEGCPQRAGSLFLCVGSGVSVLGSLL